MHRRQFLTGTRERYVGFELRNGNEAVTANRRALGGGERERFPHVLHHLGHRNGDQMLDVRWSEVWRQHAHDFVRHAIQIDRLSDYRWIRIEPTSP